MDLPLVLVIVVTSVIQSVFGVGVLLFGTPLLLMFGYPFVPTLATLLPISLTINLLQVIGGQKHIHFAFYRRLLLYSVPPIVLLLAFTVTMAVNVSFVIGLFLLLISLKAFSARVEKGIGYLFRFEKSFLLLQGIVHGLTNLGGSLLTSKVFSLKISKPEKRATISLSYLTFALFQLLTLASLDQLGDFNLYYVLIGSLVFILTEGLVYRKIPSQQYDTLFAGFLFFSGSMLIYKGVL
ncbi:TSUP family transporter [Thalassomonas viridans]|uniref:Probable membrane transporter protein n=1 Tax=Thalassomonas viridans TaxID=137584 RepID=A0AAE9Z9I8_9GAMM|nr:TSUP family transporter [Thalassomonas viridans]WDE09251.1 TSUP family transporter [Thalassomonas viridans]